MPQFMLILFEKPGDFASMSPDQIQGLIAKYGAWSAKIAQAGQLVDGKKLMEEGGKTMRKTSGKLAVSDGPYAEAKEVIGGVFVLKAKDYAEAVEIATGCPHIEYG